MMCPLGGREAECQGPGQGDGQTGTYGVGKDEGDDVDDMGDGWNMPAGKEMRGTRLMARCGLVVDRARM